MGFLSDWKTAKTAFETATKGKKPSEKFLGFFNKGTGVESALKEADNAKTAGDLTKALAKVSEAAEKYLPQLIKAAGDPTAVPTGDKKIYVDNIDKLRTALETLCASGAHIAETLDSSGKKDKVDTKALKDQADQKQFQAGALEHLKLRVQGVAEANKLLKLVETATAQYAGLVTQAKKARDTALQDSGQGNQAGALSQLGVVEKCLDIIDAGYTKLSDVYDHNVQDESSIIKRARSDYAENGKLEEDFKKPYMVKSVAAFGEIVTVTTAINKQLKAILAQQDEVKALQTETETAAGHTRPAEAYIERLTKLVAALKKIRLDLDTSRQKAEGAERTINNKDYAAAARLKSLPNVYTALDRFEEEAATQSKLIVQLKTQATKLPRGADENADVAKLIRDAVQGSDEAADMAARLTGTVATVRASAQAIEKELQGEKAA